MKALTLTQPWAQLMADGRKHYETRSWYPWRLKPGELLAITASARMQLVDKSFAQSYGYDPRALQLGCVVAVVSFVDAHKTEHSTVSDEEREYGDYTPGRFAWHCEHVLKLAEPVPCRGMLGIWQLPDVVVRSVASQMVQAAVTQR